MENIKSLEAEQSVLGAILLESKVMDDIEGVTADSFFYEQHKIIYAAINKLHRNDVEIDIIHVIEVLKKDNMLDKVGGISYITSLSTIVPSVNNVCGYVDIIRDKAKRRNIIRDAQRLIESLEEGEEIDYSLAKFEKVTEVKEDLRTDNTARSIIEKIYNKLENGEKVEKLKTGIPIIDKCTRGGINNKELVTIAGKSGGGKSCIATKIARNAYAAGKKVLFITREMSQEQVVARMLLSETGIDREKYEQSNLNADDWHKMITAMEMYSSDDFRIDDRLATVSQIKREVRRFKPDVLIIDYLQLLTPENSRDGREREVAEMSRQLKQMTLDFNMIIIQLSQMTDKGTGNWKPSGETYIRESRAPYQDSNIVIYLHNVSEDKELDIAYNKLAVKERMNKDQFKVNVEGMRENGTIFQQIIVDKNRDGAVGSNYYWFNGSDLGYYQVL